MTTVAGTISASGYTYPPFATVLAYYQAKYQGIYGSDAVLTPDTQDGQWLSIMAQIVDDLNQLAGAVYNSYSPTFAQGAGLSAVVKINGLSREAAVNATVDVTLGGVAGTNVINGVVGSSDGSNNLWSLPSLVVIPNTGSITVTATAQSGGGINAIAGAVNLINTPTTGWQSVSNALAASPGAAAQSDASLRREQALSVAGPGSTIIAAILGSVVEVTGVQEATGYENDTGVTDANGLPPHSYAIVVLGGDSQAIANAIALRAPPGTISVGNVSEVVVDSRGISRTINFYILQLQTINVSIVLKALPGYSSTTGGLIQAAVAAYVSGLPIGIYSYGSRLYAPADLAGDAAMTATGLNQQQLDALSSTYQILSISQSRAAPVAETTIQGGPYAAGANMVDVARAGNLYVNAQVSIELDDASLWNVVIGAVGGSSITFSPPIPAGRSVPNGAPVFLVTDATIAFNEQATCTVGNVAITVTG